MGGDQPKEVAPLTFELGAGTLATYRPKNIEIREPINLLKSFNGYLR
jgi:hypothetical protein